MSLNFLKLIINQSTDSWSEMQYYLGVGRKWGQRF